MNDKTKALINKNISRLNERTNYNNEKDRQYQASIIGTVEEKSARELWDKYAEARAEFEKEYNIFSGQTTDFQEQLRYLIDAKNATENSTITFESLAADIGISVKTLSRYNNGHYAPSINVLVMICISLKLDLKQSTALATSLGICFQGTNRAHYAYMYLLEKHRGETIAECNKILTGLHISKRDQLYPRSKTAN